MPPAVAQSWTEFCKALRIMFFGTIWSAVGGLVPTLVAVWYDYENYEDPTDWARLYYIFTSGALFGIIGYWRKHVALLRLPPWFKDVPLDTIKEIPKRRSTSA